MIERKARIFNIQKYNMYDGPGVRTVVFFKGCPLRCKWCSNPESQRRQYEVLYKIARCVHCGKCATVCPTGVHRMTQGGRVHEIVRSAECIGCRKCEKVCPEQALAIVGEQKSIAELLTIVEEDTPFYETSGGGLTLGGGEALMQPEALVSLLMACKQQGINTAIETCGYAKLETIRQIAEFMDLFLYDVKHMNSDRHYELTGVRNEQILSNLQWLLENKYNVMIRVPLIKGCNTDDDNIIQLIHFATKYKDYKNFKGIDLLPYHKLGVYKYGQLEQEYPLHEDSTPSEADLARIQGQIQQAGLPVTVIRH